VYLVYTRAQYIHIYTFTVHDSLTKALENTISNLEATVSLDQTIVIILYGIVVK
jgi:hypothetical protein